MTKTLDKTRKTIHDLFDNHVKKLIQTTDYSVMLKASIETYISGKLGPEYKVIAKKYDNTIRVSVQHKGLGIIFFMAATRTEHEQYIFKEPCYLGL